MRETHEDEDEKRRRKRMLEGDCMGRKTIDVGLPCLGYGSCGKVGVASQGTRKEAQSRSSAWTTSHHPLLP